MHAGMGRTAYFVLALTALTSSALEVAPRRVVAPVGRRACLGGLGGAALALAVPGAARAESVPTREELARLTAGYLRLKTLLKDWDAITGGKCGGAELKDEKRQVVATNGGLLCDKDPLKVQEYVGYKSTTDPLFKAEKLMLRAAPLADENRLDEYLESVNKWGEKAQMSSLMAYTSAWGEANPNGGKGQIAAYLEDAKYDIEDSTQLLKTILTILGLPLS